MTEFQSQLTDADFVQPRQAWMALAATPGQQDNFVTNVARSLSGAVEQVRSNSYAVFTRIDAQLGTLVTKETEDLVAKATGMKRDIEDKRMPTGKRMNIRSFREYGIKNT